MDKDFLRHSVIERLPNISQDKLAIEVDCCRRTIGNIENGTHDPSLQMAYRIANYFQVELRELFPDSNQPNAQ